MRLGGTQLVSNNFLHVKPGLEGQFTQEGKTFGRPIRTGNPSVAGEIFRDFLTLGVKKGPQNNPTVLALWKGPFFWVKKAWGL